MACIQWVPLRLSVTCEQIRLKNTIVSKNARFGCVIDGMPLKGINKTDALGHFLSLIHCNYLNNGPEIYNNLQFTIWGFQIYVQMEIELIYVIH